MSVIAQFHFLFGLDIRRLDYLGPFFGVIGDAFSEFGRRHRQRLDAQADKARLHSGIEHNGVDLLVELFDDSGRGALGRGNAIPAGCIIAL